MFLRYSSTRKKALLRACGYSPTSSTGIPESFHLPSRVVRDFALFPDSMLIIPALDIKDGRCVRLKQGKMRDATVFSEDPVSMAEHWKAEGARRLHLVDLNGAAAGKPKNEIVIRAILQALGIRRRCSWAGASGTWTRSSTISTSGSATSSSARRR